MTIKSLKARILRALKSSLAAADSPPPSPTKPGAAIRTDASSDDASFFDARDKEGGHSEEEPLDAWELVDQAAADGTPVDPAPAAPAPADPSDPAEPLLLLGLPSRCPPPGGDSRAVLYTTSLRGVRRTFDDCNAVRALLENLGAAFEERDVSLDRGLRDQLRAAAAAGEEEEGAVVPPRLFVRGRDVGGAARVLALHEDGRLAPLLLGLLPSPPPKGAAGFGGKRRSRRRCGGCGGRGFVVCGECDGSRRSGGGAARCRGCNENGLAACPLCAA